MFVGPDFHLKMCVGIPTGVKKRKKEKGTQIRKKGSKKFGKKEKQKEKEKEKEKEKDVC